MVLGSHEIETNHLAKRFLSLVYWVFLILFPLSHTLTQLKNQFCYTYLSLYDGVFNKVTGPSLFVNEKGEDVVIPVVKSVKLLVSVHGKTV